MVRWLAVVALLLGTLPLLAQQPDEGLSRVEEAFVRAVEKARASVVSITAEYDLPAEKDEEPESLQIAYSGVVIDDQGHILTVASAAKGAKEITVTAPDETEAKATVVGVDDRSNLAVLHVDADGLVPVEVAEPGSTRLGSWVIAAGNAFGMTGSVSYGIVSGLDRSLGTGEGVFTNMLQTTAPVNPGDSGGLLANSKGQLVGIISSTFQRAPSIEKFQETLKDLTGRGQMDSFLKDLQDLQAGGATDAVKLQQVFARWMKKLAERSAAGPSRMRRGPMSGQLLGAEGVNFATPAETVRFVTKQLVEKGKVDRGWLGVEVQTVPGGLRKKLGLVAGAAGVLVSRVVEDGPAAQGGLKEQDVILKLNGKPLARLGDLERFVAQSAAGTQLTVEVASGGERKELVVKLGTRPEK